jgi:hypothetical protein
MNELFVLDILSLRSSKQPFQDALKSFSQNAFYSNINGSFFLDPRLPLKHPDYQSLEMLPTSIFVPLYMYPSLNPSAWEPLYTAAAKYPQLTFNAVGAYLSNPHPLIIKPTQLSVNIANGPGPNPVSDTNYIISISTLHTYPNINTLGCVHIRISPSNSTILCPTADVVAEIAQYSTWNLPSSRTQAQDIHLNGIFIDEAPSDVGNYTYMSTLTSAAREHSFSLVIFNPGVVDTVRMYFNLADYIVMFENSYAYYSTGGGRFLGYHRAYV